MNAPELSRRDLEKQVRQMIAAGRKRFLLAFHGRGPDDVLEIEGTRIRVLAVRSELDLRRRLLEVPRDEYAAFLIPWREASLPVDLQGRFARDGKIQIVGREERLYARFGVSELDDDVGSSALAAYLLTHHCEEPFPIVGGRLTMDSLWTTYLARVWNLDAGGELALDALLGWAAVDGRGPLFVATIKERNAEPVRTALIDHLCQKLGPIAGIVWEAWEAGRGAATLEFALVLGALNQSERAMVWSVMTAEQVFGKPIDATVLKRLGETADAALRFLARPARGEPSVVRAFVLAADQRAMSSVIAADVGGSSRLPSAWRARLDELGRALSAVAEAPSAGSVRAAVDASREVWHHDMARDPDQVPVLRRAEMALRLASWLAVRSDRELPPSTTEYGDVENLAAWYASEGGYLDHARRFARGAREGAFAEGVQAVVSVVDDIRLELDRRFARGLPAWHRAGRRATQVVPIDQAVQRIASSFLEGDAQRRLLVVLMDGMAWSQAIELLTSMGNRASVWGPLAWHGMAKHRVGEGAHPAVLTNFPTVTEVSRSAFFGGKPIPPGAATNASQDTEKWKANRDVQKHVSGNAVPQLRLRGDGQTKDGSASPDALELVLDPSQRIVAVVINAIDMSLKADRAHEIEWKLDNVKALRDLLDKAMEAGRAVLLCSDHGHVPSDRMESTGVPMREGARWRVWQNAADPLADYEVGLAAGDGVWAPRGAYGIAMIADDAHRYGGGTGSGEHGGASLAEVVAPCVLIGCADVPAAVDDAGQAVRPTSAPSWWFFDVGEVAATAVAPDDSRKKPRKSTKKATAEQPQQFLPTFVPTAPVVVAIPVVTESPLAISDLFIARAGDAKTRQQALRAVEFLRVRKGVASSAAFAAELGEFAARVQGVVAKLQEILNVDGYQVLRYDRQHQQVHLDFEKLAQQFELDV